MTNQRYSTTIASVTVDVIGSIANSSAINFADYERGSIIVPSGAAYVTLTWHTCGTENGTYLPANNASGAAITQTVVAGNSYPIPSDLAGSRFLKITGNAAGVVGVTLKD